MIWITIAPSSSLLLLCSIRPTRRCLGVMPVHSTCPCPNRSRRCARVPPSIILLSTCCRSILLGTVIRCGAIARVLRCSICGGSGGLRRRGGCALVLVGVSLVLVRLASYRIVVIVVLAISRCHRGAIVIRNTRRAVRERLSTSICRGVAGARPRFAAFVFSGHSVVFWSARRHFTQAGASRPAEN